MTLSLPRTNSMSRFFLALTLFVGLSSVAAAQNTSTFVGTWDFEVATSESMRMPSNNGTLTISSRGDSLVMRVEFLTSSGAAATPARTLVGVASQQTATFTQVNEGAVQAGDHSSGIRAFSTWKLILNGQALSGDITFDITGISVQVDPIRVRATRSTR